MNTALQFQFLGIKGRRKLVPQEQKQNELFKITEEEIQTFNSTIKEKIIERLSRFRKEVNESEILTNQSKRNYSNRIIDCISMVNNHTIEELNQLYIDTNKSIINLQIDDEYLEFCRKESLTLCVTNSISKYERSNGISELKDKLRAIKLIFSIKEKLS